MPHKLLIALDETINLNDAYYRAIIDPSPECINDRGCELRKRLKQLSRLSEKIISIDSATTARLEQIGKLHEQAIASGKAADIPREWFCENLIQEEDLELYTETFYYLAFRARTLIRSFPGLSSFEAKGIRDVRNHLLEHPEGNSSGVHINSFAHGGVCGPVIKGLRYDHQADLHKDRGLYVNLEEFIVGYKSKLERSLKPLFGIDFNNPPAPERCIDDKGRRLAIQLALCVAREAHPRELEGRKAYLTDRHRQFAADAKLLGASDAEAETFAAQISALVLRILANPAC